jgi:hypothetical protein
MYKTENDCSPYCQILFLHLKIIPFDFQMTFGEQNTEKEAHDILSYSFDHGVNILDTAEIVSANYFLTFINYLFLCFEVD